MRNSLFAISLFAIGLSAAEPKGVAAFSPSDKIEGKTQAEWSAEWWKWALRFEKTSKPVTDTTGEFAAKGQPDKVWFLAGSFGGITKRGCSIPADRPILAPVFNYVASQPSKEREPAALKTFEKEMAAEAKEIVDRAEGLTLTVDGVVFDSVKKHRHVSAIFETSGPSAANAVHPSVAGKQTGVSDGYWVFLKPLAPGKHTIRIQSSLKAKKGEPPFELDVTYELTVEKKK